MFVVPWEFNPSTFIQLKINKQISKQSGRKQETPLMKQSLCGCR